MERRGFLMLAGLGLSSGCAGGQSTTEFSEGEIHTSEGEIPSSSSPCEYSGGYASPSDDKVKLQYHPGEDGDSIQTMERVEVQCVGDVGIDLDGTKLVYTGDLEYPIESIQLTPNQSALIVSTASGSSTIETCPPTLVRGAGFDSRIGDNGSGTITLQSPEGEEIEAVSYT